MQIAATSRGLEPERSAPELAAAVIATLKSRGFPYVMVSLPNREMLGHMAAREAGRVMDAAVECGYSVIFSADHGNCDEMVVPVTGDPHTQHTTYPVPSRVVDEIPWRLSTDGI